MGRTLLSFSPDGSNTSEFLSRWSEHFWVSLQMGRTLQRASQQTICDEAFQDTPQLPTVLQLHHPPNCAKVTKVIKQVFWESPRPWWHPIGGVQYALVRKWLQQWPSCSEPFRWRQLFRKSLKTHLSYTYTSARATGRKVTTIGEHPFF